MSATNVLAAAFMLPFALVGVGLLVALLLRRYIARNIVANRTPADDGPWSGGWDP